MSNISILKIFGFITSFIILDGFVLPVLISASNTFEVILGFSLLGGSILAIALYINLVFNNAKKDTAK